jgi:hypothetical protein
VKASPREREGICRWKALRIGKAALVDARVVEAVLALSASLQKRGALGVKWGVRGRVADPPRGRKRRARMALPARGARLSSLPHKEEERRRSTCPKLERVVKRGFTWGRIGERRSGAAVRMALGLALGAHQGGGHRGASRELGNRAEFTGARIERRLQKSVRHIFPAHLR